MNEVSIALLTFNGEHYLDEVLTMIERQRHRPDEILAIDSGSSDHTIQILKRHGVKTYQISQKEFSHPGTRNLATRLAQGKYVIFLTQDATPADSCWLETLLAPLKEFPKVAAVYSRQIPRPGCDPLEAVDLSRSFKKIKVIKSKPSDEQEYKQKAWQLIHFSNSSSIYNRELLIAQPFLESLQMAEDQEWSKRMLEKGYSIVYEPASVVLHSHTHNLKQKYSRNFSMGRSFASFLRPLIGNQFNPVPGLLYNFLTDPSVIMNSGSGLLTKLRWLCVSPLHRLALHYGFYQGWKSQICSGIPARSDNEAAMTLQ